MAFFRVVETRVFEERYIIEAENEAAARRNDGTLYDVITGESQCLSIDSITEVDEGADA